MSQTRRRDLLHSQEIKELVHDAYRTAADPAGALARKLYSTEELAQVPPLAADGSSVSPTRFATPTRRGRTSARRQRTVCLHGCGGARVRLTDASVCGVRKERLAEIFRRQRTIFDHARR